MMRRQNIFKTLICMLAFAALPVTAAAHAEEVSVPETSAVVYAEEVTTTAIASAIEVTTTVTEVTTSDTETTTTADSSETTTTADETTTTDVETVTTTYDPNRIAVEDVQLNATEADVAAGRTYQIKTTKLPLNATDNIAVRYISSDESIATVDSKGVVTAHKPGKVTITVIADSMIPIVQDKTVESYTVLVLDNSTSMRGDPMVAQKEAAIKFCKETLESNTQTDYKFAIVAFGTSIQTASEFTNDITKLTDTINDISLTGATNYMVALEKAAELLNNAAQNAVKNIVFCSDGIPNRGGTSSNGPFTSADGTEYAYANAAVNKANELRQQGYNIYTLGFFHNISDSTKPFANELMKDIASAPDMSYIVNDPEKLSSVFSEVSNSVVNYNRVGTFKKAVELEVTPAKAEPAKKTEEKKAASSDQDSPKTGDNNHNTMLISILFIGVAAAAVAGKSRRTDK